MWETLVRYLAGNTTGVGGREGLPPLLPLLL